MERLVLAPSGLTTDLWTMRCRGPEVCTSLEGTIQGLKNYAALNEAQERMDGGEVEG